MKQVYDLRADIGDTVQIADNRFQEKVYLSARIQSVRNHYTVSGQDSGVLANYKILTSNPTSQVTQIMEQLKDQIVSVKSTEITYQIGGSGVEPPEGQWVPNPPQTSPGQYLWTRKNKQLTQMAARQRSILYQETAMTEKTERMENQVGRTRRKRCKINSVPINRLPAEPQFLPEFGVLRFLR